MRFRIGDVVRLKSLDRVIIEYGMNSVTKRPDIPHGCNANMLDLFGKEYTISNIYDQVLRFREDEGNYAWHECLVSELVMSVLDRIGESRNELMQGYYNPVDEAWFDDDDVPY